MEVKKYPNGTKQIPFSHTIESYEVGDYNNKIYVAKYYYGDI